MTLGLEMLILAAASTEFDLLVDVVVTFLVGSFSSRMIAKGDMVGGVLKLVKGVLLLILTLVDPGPGLSRRGLNTESLDNLRVSEFLRSNPSLESMSLETLPLT